MAIAMGCVFMMAISLQEVKRLSSSDIYQITLSNQTGESYEGLMKQSKP